MKMLSVYQLMTDNALAINTSTNTASVKTDFCTGYGTIYVSNSAGSVLIMQQVSVDNVTYFNPVDEVGNSLAVIASGIVKGTTSMVQYNPALSPYTRFVVVEGNSGATKTAITVMLQEEN